MSESTVNLRIPTPLDSVAGIHRMREGGSERRGFVGLDRNERVGALPEWFVREVQASIGSDLMLQYPAVDELDRELAAATGLPPEQLLVTPGNDPVIKGVYQAYVRPGDAVVMLDPSYAMYDVYARMFGARAVHVPFDADLVPDLAFFADQISAGARLALIANPNQPTGTVIEPTALQGLLARAAESGTLVLVDEAYSFFADVDALPLIAESPNLLVARSFSKAGMAGIRIGFVAGQAPLVETMFKIRSAAEVNAVAILCARKLLAHPEVAADYARAVDEGRRLLEPRLEALGFTTLPTHANFLLFRLNGVADPADVVSGLRERSYLIKGPFPNECLRDCLRVTLGPPDEMAAFADVLEEVVDAP